MIHFAALEWLILVPVIVVLAWKYPRLGLTRPLRLICLALVLLLLVQPQLRQLGKGLDLWVLVDRSASTADAMARGLSEWQTLLQRSKSPDDRLFYVDYADVPVLRDEGTASFSGDPQQTRTRLAIQYALSRLDPDRASRLLVLTDGFSTESLEGVAERLGRQKTSLDYRLTRSPDVEDFEISALRAPTRVQPGEPFLFQVEVAGNVDRTLEVEISKDGVAPVTFPAQVRQGRGLVRFTDRLRAGGSHRYRVRLPVPDARSGNNSAEQWIEVQGGPRVLLATSYTDDPVAGALQSQGFEVKVVQDLNSLDVGQLSGAKAVILNNVPAYRLPPDFLSAIDFYVRVQGGGLVMVGGQYSFGSGGYFGSAVADLLPVSMELRADQRKLAVAMAIVMDRSGSMGATVASGATKMALANEGAGRAIGLLSGWDAVSVIAVDSAPHAVVPMTRIGKEQANIIDAVRRITVGGGGIYVYEGLKAGWVELQKSPAGQRHLILFADAADAEEPGDYKKLLEEMRAGDATVSVIGLGTEKDVDADFLKDVAARGGGRIFFNADANTLPALFEQETVAVARSAFNKDPVGLRPTSGWLEIAEKLPKWPAEIDAYNLSYLKEEATAAAFSKDEYDAPLIAFWQRGPGRAAAISFPLGGDYSGRVRAWEGYGDFIRTLVRWTGGEAVPPGTALRTKVNGNELEIDLLFDDKWQDRLAKKPPEIVVALGASGKPFPLVWERLEPGRYQTKMPLSPGTWVRGAASVGEYTLPFGPITTVSNPEWTLNPERVNELRNVSRLSGGVERVDFGTAWPASTRQEYRDVRPWLLMALLVVVVADALVTRAGWRMPQLGVPKFGWGEKGKTRPVRVGKKGKVEKAKESEKVDKPIEQPPEKDGEERGSRFQRAKRGGK